RVKRESTAKARLKRDRRDRPSRVARTCKHAASSIQSSFECKFRESSSRFLKQHLNVARRNALTCGKLIKTARDVLHHIGLDRFESRRTDAPLGRNLPTFV